MLKNQKGISFIEALLLTPFFLFFLMCLLTMSFLFGAKTTVPAAAREAARAAAAYGEVGTSSMGWQKAKDTIQGSLPTVSIGSHNGISKTFSPEKDIVITKESGYYSALVSYHVIAPAPGFAKLFDPNATMLDRYITIKGRAYFPDEDLN